MKEPRLARLGSLGLVAAVTLACSGSELPGISSSGGATGTQFVAGASSTASGGSSSSGGYGVNPGGGRNDSGGVGVTGGTRASGGTLASGAGTNSTGGATDTSSIEATGGAATGGTLASGGIKATGGTATGGTLATGGMRGTGGAKATGGASSTSCPYTGHVTYTLAKSATPTPAEQAAYTLITAAMDKAVAFYNCYTNITKAENVSYNTSVSTADGNINGSLRFGSSTTYMDFRTALHEISHTVGIGQASNWSSFISNGLFTGTNAKAQLAAINATLATPLDTAVHADTQHFWPYGINQQSEVKSETDLANIVGHCQMVMAIRKDLGMQ